MQKLGFEMFGEWFGLRSATGVALMVLALGGSAWAQGKLALPAGATYDVTETDAAIPKLVVTSKGQPFYRMPVVSGLSATTGEEKLTDVRVGALVAEKGGSKRLEVTATSSLWQGRRFVWRFYRDRIEFQQFADGSVAGDGGVMRAYFFSNGISDYYTDGTSPGLGWNTLIDAGTYFAPNATFDNEFIQPIESSQSLGVFADGAWNPRGRSQQSRLFSPAPLVLSFESSGRWGSVGLGTEPGKYQFGAFEFSGAHAAGASFWVNYQGMMPAKGFASPVITLHFGETSMETMAAYMKWMDAKGFSTKSGAVDATWHRLPIFCGWSEQGNVAYAMNAANPDGPKTASNKMATQELYTKWIAELERRKIEPGIITIDDKWMTTYGGLDVDTKKWPDMKAFVDAQHAAGRHVVLWLPVASTEGLPVDLTVTRNGKPQAADVSNPAYEAFLRGKIRHLVADVGIDGFKEDWVGAPGDFRTLKQVGNVYGIEFVRRFQWILFSEAHKWRPDAFVETQTPNPEFRESSDVLRLNDVYTATRNLSEMMTTRASIARVAGWKLVDTDNGGTSTLAQWWPYMHLEPKIGMPSLLFISETPVTHERPTDAQWKELAEIWRTYRASVMAGSAKK